MRKLSIGWGKFTIGSFCAFVILLGGCDPHPKSQALTRSSAITAIDLALPGYPAIVKDGVHLRVAKNAWSDFVIRLDRSSSASQPSLVVPHLADGIEFTAFQILPAAVDLNQADFVRQTGESALPTSVPRVLLPLPITNGVVDLAAMKDSPLPAMIWIDVHVAPNTVAGNYKGTCALTDGALTDTADTVPIQIDIENLTLPSPMQLHFTAALDWTALARLYPDTFEAAPPRLLNRDDPRRTGLLRLINDYIQLAHENNTDLFVPQLQPIVKWPLGKMPEVDWSDFDSVVAPWLDGSAFADHRPISFWPLPATDSLPGFNIAAKSQYWHVVANHFAQQKWLEHSPILLNANTGQASNEAESILLSAEARQILTAESRATLVLGLRDDQIQLQSGMPILNAISTKDSARVIAAAPDLVSESATPKEYRHWIDATRSAAAVSSQQGMRSLAWRAFEQDASLILCGSALPDGNRPAAADHIVWAYPGQNYGLDQPLATIQLKWMRQAAQDFEYLWLCKQHGGDVAEGASKICELIAQPVHLRAGQSNQPVFNLFAGDAQTGDCESARQMLLRLLARNAGDQSVDMDSIRWFAAHEKQTLINTGVDWKWNLEQGGIDAQLNIQIYNTAASMPNGGHLLWNGPADGWDVAALPTAVGPVGPYQVNSATVKAIFNPKQISPQSRRPMQFNFVDDFTGEMSTCKIVLPVAISERRQKPLSLDGMLNDWFPADAIQLNQPLVKMLNRPALQAGNLEFSATPSSIYTCWSDDSFYLAFRLGGVSAEDLRSTRNFVQYDQGRAWGEDLCEMLIQPIYIDNSTGPTIHVVCKPGGSWVEQQTDQKTWQPFEACGIRYASGVEPSEKIWRGEVAIPWKAINTTGHGRPALLRFNFIQHQNATAESASWAGPIDQSRDGTLAGLLFIKD